MKRIQQYQRILHRRQTVPLVGEHPLDPVLRRLLVHTVFAKATVEVDELSTLALLVPEVPLDELKVWVQATACQPLNLHAIRAALPLQCDRFALMRLVHLMVHIDPHADPSWLALLDDLHLALLDQH